MLRDFVEPWYGILSMDETFKESLRCSSNQAASVFSQWCPHFTPSSKRLDFNWLACSLSNVNWEQLLTQDLVDDFASHIRLYRKARERILK